MFLTICLDNSRVEISRLFYERLGLEFSSEQHGPRGLPHFATVLPEVPSEIYPTIKLLPPEERLFLGFTVDDPATLGKELVNSFGGRDVEPPVPLTASGIVALRDPNGVLIRLFPRPLQD